MQMKFLDGTPVDPGYEKAISSLVSGAAAAIEEFGEDELERFASEQAAEQENHRVGNPQ